MTCTHCGTELPRGAMFCGECGRAVAPPNRIVPPASVVPQPDGNQAPELHCEQCGAAMAAADIFCGECGFVARSVTDNFTTGPRTPAVPIQPPPVLFVEPPAPPPLRAPQAPRSWHEPEPTPAATPAAQPTPELIDSDSIPWFTDSRPKQPPVAPQPLVVPPVAAPEVLVAPPAAVAPPASVAAPAPVAPPAPATPVNPVHQAMHSDTARIDPVELASLPRPDDLAQPPTEPLTPVLSPRVAAVEDIEATRIVRRTHGGDPFVLQFSTGENLTVTGSGLLGRNPQTQPGEYFDHLVPIFDPGKSVSKTHLEFGQESGVFWVTDRFSGNGSVVREPGTAPRRCEPGKRYRVTRGTRVDIGEQFLIIS
nr:zinc-ribbon domain-containing protein [Salinibacterium sp. ZJ454]